MCEFTQKCWRYSYSKYYLTIEKYQAPPDRQTLFVFGCATLEQMPKKGMFAENMPDSSHEHFLCPHLACKSINDCYERNKEVTRMERQKNKVRTVKFQNKEERLPIPREIRLEVAARQNYKCAYCGRAQNSIDERGNKIQTVVDHVVPLALGGNPTDTANLTLACRECNRDKSTEIWKFGCRKDYYDKIF